MIFPISTDRRTNSLPWVTGLLIVANCIIYVLVTREQMLGGPEMQKQLESYVLDSAAPRLFQFISYQFLHGDPFHLVGNMLFLYIFGRLLEDRVGKFAYLCFYLAAGVFAGIGHCLVEVSPVIGASGSIAGVSGAYLALFPETRIKFFYIFWLYWNGTFEISSKYVILFYIATNVFSFVAFPGSGVAYSAHLAGYAFGFAVGMGLLLTRILPREKYDLLALLEHRRRRHAFINGQREADEAIAAAQNRVLTPDEQISHKLRTQITQRFAAHDPGGAARIYRDLVRHEPKALLNRQQQLDVANQLMSERKHDDAALAYQKFLDNNNPDPQRHEVQLLLALLLVRYLSREDADGSRAKALLTEASKRMGSDHEKQLADQLLAELAKRTGPRFS